MSMNEKFLRMAMDVAAEKSADGRCGPFGAVVERDGEVVGIGWNRVVTSCDPTAHAEIVAIREACVNLATHDLSGCALYASCEPCPMCLAAIYWARIGKVVYAADRRDAAEAGFDDDYFYRQLSLPPAERAIEFVQSLHEEGRAVLMKWKENPGRIMY